MTHLPRLPTGRQAQAGISKEDYTDFWTFLETSMGGGKLQRYCKGLVSVIFLPRYGREI